MTSAIPVRPQVVPSLSVGVMQDVCDCLWKYSLTAAQTPAVESDGPVGHAACWSMHGRNVYLGAW